MKKRTNSKRFKNSVLANKLPVIVAGLLLIFLLTFLFIYNHYEEAFVIDIDGYMIGDTNLDSIKITEETEEKVDIKTVHVKSEEAIMKNSFDHYVSNEKKESVNVDYPLFVNDGLTIINYNENINLLDSNFNRTLGFPNLVLSYGKIYDNVTYTQLDQESYLFISYQDGIYINLYDIRIETVANTHIIPVNSFIYFFEGQLNYFARKDDKFEKGTIDDVDFSSKVFFYYLGSEECFEYTYEEVITLTGSVYIAPEPEEKPIEPEPEPEPEEEVVERPKPSVRPNNPTRPNKPPADEEERYWEKPSVQATSFKANVYSLEGAITIEDPAGVIIKDPTYTLYVNNKITSRRTFYQTGDVIITGLSSDTEYVVVGQYSYLDQDFETIKIVTFIMDSVKTKDRSNLEKIKIEQVLSQNIYPKKIEFDKIQIKSSLDTEGIRGVKKIGIRMGNKNGTKETFVLNTKLTQSLLKGEKITVISTDILKSGSDDVEYQILFFDKDNNIIEAENNTGTARTCKNMPSLFLKVVNNNNIDMRISLELRNDDNVVMNNYRYVLEGTNQYGLITKKYIDVTDLEPDKVYSLKVYADIDLNDGPGGKSNVVPNVLLNEIKLVTLPIGSLGKLNLQLKSNNITASTANVSISINESRTDSRLVILLESITLKLFNNTTGELKKEIKIEDNDKAEDITLLKGGATKEIVISELDSNTEYRVEFSATGVQGGKPYTIDCAYFLNPIVTKKKAAEVDLTHLYVNEEMIDFDCKIDDPDDAIIPKEVVVEVRTLAGNLIKTSIVKTNQSYVRLTYQNLKANSKYKINIYAEEYNETRKDSTSITKHVLYEREVTTVPGISGTIEPISSLREATGENIIDVESETKWFQIYNYYNIPKTVKTNEYGQKELHLYSKNGNADYSYDLSEYEGKLVKVSFSIKSITPDVLGRKIYVSNYLLGNTGSTYGQLVTLDGGDETYVEKTFRVGYYKHTSDTYYDAYKKCTDVYYGKNRANFLSIYIQLADSSQGSFEAEYVITDMKAYIIEEEDTEYLPKDEELRNTIEPTFERGKWNSSAGKVDPSDMKELRIQQRIYLEEGYTYKFYFNTQYANIYIFKQGTSKAFYSYEQVYSGQIIKTDSRAFIYVYFYNKNSAAELSPGDVEFTIKRTKTRNKIFSDKDAEFLYKLVTKVKINITDSRNEINNDRYYVRVYEDGKELTCPNYEGSGIEKLEKIPCNVYDEVNKAKDVIKNLELTEKHTYNIELAVYINERYYTLSNFEITTDNELKGISTIEEWEIIQPRGHYLLLNDLSLKNYDLGEVLGYGYRYFYGMIDFQGHTVSTYASAIGDNKPLQIIGRAEKSAVFKNLVLDVHLDINKPTTYDTGFVSNNYGTFENVYINIYRDPPLDEEDSEESGEDTEEEQESGAKHLTNQYIAPLVSTNQVSGVIRNFVVNVVDEMNLYSHSSLLVRTNYGTVENGYIYGNDINIDPLYSSSSSNLGLVQVYGGPRSTIRNVYVIPSMIHSPNSNLITGLVSYESYGVVEDIYTVGESNFDTSNSKNTVNQYGPVVGYVRASATMKNVYYYNPNVYKNTYQTVLSATALNDVAFQEKLLGDGFIVTELVKLGYYPHVNFSSNKMPLQPYLDLPKTVNKNEIDIISSKVISQTGDSAVVEFSINNKNAVIINNIAIEELSCVIERQTYKEGTTTVTATLSNPASYKSEYQVRRIKYTDRGYEDERYYKDNEKFVEVEFYKQIHTKEDWKNIDISWNYELMEDLDFSDSYDFYIKTYSGILKGNGHTITGVNIKTGTYPAIIENLDGTIKDLNFKNITKTNDEYVIKKISSTNYVSGSAIIAVATATARIDNVHATNITIEPTTPKARSSLHIGGLIGHLNNGKISNSSINGIKIVYDATSSDLSIGGLIGSTAGGTITHSFASNVDIKISKTVGVAGVGGLIGRVKDGNAGDSVITFNYSSGKITSNNIYTGGLVGNTDGSIENCYSAVNVSSDLGYLGGIAGYSSNTSIKNTLYVGNLFTPKNSAKIVPSVVVNDTNYSLDKSLINGVESSYTNGESSVTAQELEKASTYTDLIELGDSYDYSQSASRILPKLYYENTTTLLPNQEDITFATTEFQITAMDVREGKSDQYDYFANVTLSITNPNQYKLKGAIVDGARIINANNDGDKETIIIHFLPEKYYDYYKLSGLIFEIDGKDVTIDKQNLINFSFYKTIKSFEDWQNISSLDAENYYLDLSGTTDNCLDLSAEAAKRGETLNTKVVVNRLIGVPYKGATTELAGQNPVLKGWKLEYGDNREGTSLIEKVITSISDIDFKDISIKDSSTGSNYFVNIIRYNYGDMTNVNFENINIYAPKEYHVGMIGTNYAQNVTNINLKNITVHGYDVVGGFIAYAENGEGRSYSYINAEDIKATAAAHRLGGIFGQMRVSNSTASYLIHDISIKGSITDVNGTKEYSTIIQSTSGTGTYIGGITGQGDCDRYCTAENIKVVGVRYVGGIYGQGLSIYSRDHEVTNSIIIGKGSNAYYVGGIGGRTHRLYRSYVIDSEITFTHENAYGLGGISGYMSNWYYFRSNGITNSIIGTNGQQVGGLVGYQASGEVYTSYVQDCTISGASMVGGVSGRHAGGYATYNHITRSTVTATSSMAGGMIGKLQNSTTGQPYVRLIEATDMVVSAGTQAGGIFGAVNTDLAYPNQIYSLYFEGTISSSTANTVGLATGDDYNEEILTLNRIYFYEDTKLYNTGHKSDKHPEGWVSAEELTGEVKKSANMLANTTLVKQYTLGSKGEEVYNYDYRNGGYIKDYIELEAGKTYTIGVTAKSGYDWLRVKVYNMEGTFVSDLSSSNANYYPRAYLFSKKEQVTFRVLRDCYIRVMFFNMDQIESKNSKYNYYLHEVTYGDTSVNKNQLLDYNDLINRATWTTYGSSTTSTTTHTYTTKLGFNYSYFDFDPINNQVGGTTEEDKLEIKDKINQIPANVIATSLQDEGLILDGANDTVVASGFTQKSNDFTVSLRITALAENPGSKQYQYLYLYEDISSSTSNGFGIFMYGSNREIYVRNNRSNYATGVYIPLASPTEITVTYSEKTSGYYHIIIYRNGVMKKELKTTVTKPVVISNNAKTYISPDSTSNGNSKFNGIYERLLVYNDTLTAEQVTHNYNDNFAKDLLALHYDFTNLGDKYSYKEGASYPIVKEASSDVKDNGVIPEIKYQKESPGRLTPLPNPILNNRTYFSNLTTPTTQATQSAMYSVSQLSDNTLTLNKNLNEIYNIYVSNTNTINLEFDKVYTDVSFKYKNGDYETSYQRQRKRVYTIRYDFKNDLEITLRTTSNYTKVITLTKEDLARTIQIVNGKYYHIENNKLYENSKKIADNAYNIYNNLVLLDNNQIYSINSKEIMNVEYSKGILNKVYPLAEYDINDKKIETYYNFSQITDLDGTTVIRDAQIHIKNGHVYIFDSSENTKQDMNVFNNFNTEEYQISLIDGHLISIKEEINFPSYFINNNIKEINHDITSDKSIILVRYSTDYVIAFDYYTGKELFTYGKKPKISLGSYIAESISGDYVLSSSNDSFKESNKLKETLINDTDQEIKDKLVDKKPSVIKPNENTPNGEENTETSPIIKDELNDDYIQVYNSSTQKYDIFSTEELLNTDKSKVESTSSKIRNDAFLYNYFYGSKTNTFFEKTKVAIYVGIISLVIFNLLLFIRNINTKEVKQQ